MMSKKEMDVIFTGKNNSCSYWEDMTKKEISYYFSNNNPNKRNKKFTSNKIKNSIASNIVIIDDIDTMRWQFVVRVMSNIAQKHEGLDPNTYKYGVADITYNNGHRHTVPLLVFDNLYDTVFYSATTFNAITWLVYDNEKLYNNVYKQVIGSFDTELIVMVDQDIRLLLPSILTEKDRQKYWKAID